MKISSYHKPVLFPEVIDYLEVKPGEKYIDATLGLGGHAHDILIKKGKLLGIERAGENLAAVRESFKKFPAVDWKLVQGNFSDIRVIAETAGFGAVSGVLFDLGISSWQLDKSGRGFRFRSSDRLDEQLDMRMDQSQELTAGYVVNKYSKDELYEVLSRYGELREANRLAVAIMKARPMTTASQLIDAVAGVSRSGSLLARLFQALRIEVNQELLALKVGLAGASELLDSGGRLAVISFHSLEDRLIKRTFTDWVKNGKVEFVTRLPVTASDKELKVNLRAKSAKLRVVMKK